MLVSAHSDVKGRAFRCVVAIIHHCGIEGTRPRGHTSLTGAADAQLAVKRDGATRVIVTVEWMKDGPEGDSIASKLETIEVGTDEDGEIITSCVILPAELPAATPSDNRLTPNQQTMYRVLHEAGPRGLSLEDWYERARSEGIGIRRRGTSSCRPSCKGSCNGNHEWMGG